MKNQLLVNRRLCITINGEEKTVELNEYRDQPLRMKAYLKLKVNPRKGVISWNEVTEKEVPEKALEKLK